MKNINANSKKTIEKEMIALVLSFIQNLLSFPNVEQAKNLLREQAQLIYNKFFKREMKCLESEIEQLENRVEKSEKILKKLEKKAEKIRKRMRVGGQFLNKQFFSVFLEWSPKNQLSFILTASFMFIMLATGTINVYTNIMSSGNPLFLETPFFAVLISMLFPAGTFSLKYLRESIENEGLKKFFTQSVYILTFFSILFWGHQFSLNFTGLSAGIDLDSLSKSMGTGHLMIEAQLLAEFMVSVSSYFALIDNFNLYLPDSKDNDPESLHCEKVRDEHFQTHEKLLQELNEKTGRLEQLKDDCQAFVNLAIAKFLSLRIHHDKTSLNNSLKRF